MNQSRNGEELASPPYDVDSMTAEQRVALGRMIAGWREERGFTMLQLSEAAGVDRKTIRTIENGTRAGQPSKLHALLEALDIPQAGDFDSFSERTRMFILSAAPIFEQIPDEAKSDAQADVVTLLAGKLRRTTGGNVTHADFGRGAFSAPAWIPDTEREAAAEGFEINHDHDDHGWDA